MANNVQTSSHLEERVILRELIKQAYTNRSQHGYTPQWETMKTRLNEVVFSNVDVKDEDAFDAAYRVSIRLLGQLHFWYFKHFLNDERAGLANIVVEVPVSHSIVSHTVDLVMIDPIHNIVPVFFNTDSNEPSLHNNLRTKTILWLLQKETSLIPTRFEYYLINQDFSIRVHNKYDKSSLEDIEQTVNYIVRGIENRIYYPSVSSQCDTCNWLKICNL